MAEKECYRVKPVANICKNFTERTGFDVNVNEIVNAKLEYHDLNKKLKGEGLVSKFSESNSMVSIRVELPLEDASFGFHRIPDLIVEHKPIFTLEVETFPDKDFYAGVCNSDNILLPSSSSNNQGECIYSLSESKCWVLVKGKEKRSEVVQIYKYYVEQDKNTKHIISLKEKYIGRQFLNEKNTILKDTGLPLKR